MEEANFVRSTGEHHLGNIVHLAQYNKRNLLQNKFTRLV